MIYTKISERLQEIFKGSTVVDPITANTLVGAVESEKTVTIKGIKYRKIQLRIVDNIGVKMEEQIENLIEKLGRQQQHFDMMNEHIDLKKNKIISLQNIIKGQEQNRHLEQEQWKREKQALIKDLNKEHDLRVSENYRWQKEIEGLIQLTPPNKEEYGKNLAGLKLEYRATIKSQENSIKQLKLQLNEVRKTATHTVSIVQDEEQQNVLLKAGIDKELALIKGKFAAAIKVKNHCMIDLQHKVTNQRTIINGMLAKRKGEDKPLPCPSEKEMGSE